MSSSDFIKLLKFMTICY